MDPHPLRTSPWLARSARFLVLGGALSVGGWARAESSDAEKAPKASTSAWTVTPFARPILNVGGAVVNGRTTAQATLGGEAGVDMARPGTQTVGWAGRTRARALGQYGLTSNSLGYEVRLGSFIGPSAPVWSVRTGPDFFVDGYGRETSEDYWLPPTGGVMWTVLVEVRLDQALQLQGGVAPGWVTNPERRAPGIAPLHELSMWASVALRISGVRASVQVQRRYTSAGPLNSLVFSGGL